MQLTIFPGCHSGWVRHLPGLMETDPVDPGLQVRALRGWGDDGHKGVLPPHVVQDVVDAHAHPILSVAVPAHHVLETFHKSCTGEASCHGIQAALKTLMLLMQPDGRVISHSMTYPLPHFHRNLASPSPFECCSFARQRLYDTYEFASGWGGVARTEHRGQVSHGKLRVDGLSICR